jgi:hypothetical protein
LPLLICTGVVRRPQSRPGLLCLYMASTGFTLALNLFAWLQ